MIAGVRGEDVVTEDGDHLAVLLVVGKTWVQRFSLTSMLLTSNLSFLV